VLATTPFMMRSDASTPLTASEKVIVIGESSLTVPGAGVTLVTVGVAANPTEELRLSMRARTRFMEIGFSPRFVRPFLIHC
jgi:hypothetical protein